MKLRPTLTSEQIDQFELQLGTWGPLACDAEMLRRFSADWHIEPVTQGQLQTEALAFTLESFGVNTTFERVGDTGFNGDGYNRVAAVGGRALKKGSKVAVIPVMGPVTPFQAPKWYADWGIRVAALPNILTAARAAANDPEVGRIIYVVHSPGGSAFGVGEAAAALREVSKVKPTAAAVTYLSASAAYWLSSAQREIVAAPSAMIGSVGVRITHVEVSEALKMEGVAVTEISKPESKSDVSPYKPLSETARAELLRLVSTEYKTFSADISAARRVDMNEVGQQYGRVHSASDAKAIGLIDRVATLESLLVDAAAVGDMTATRRAKLALLEIETNA